MSIDIQNIDLSKMKKWTPESILKKKRIESGFTQKQVADILGISLRQWQRYEKDDDDFSDVIVKDVIVYEEKNN